MVKKPAMITQEHPGSRNGQRSPTLRESKPALTLDLVDGEARADFCHFGNIQNIKFVVLKSCRDLEQGINAPQG